MPSVSQIVQRFKQNWLVEIDPAAIEVANGGSWRAAEQISRHARASAAPRITRPQATAFQR